MLLSLELSLLKWISKALHWRINQKSLSSFIHIVSPNHIFSCLNLFVVHEIYRVNNLINVAVLMLVEQRCPFLFPELVFSPRTPTYIPLLASYPLLSVFLGPFLHSPEKSTSQHGLSCRTEAAEHAESCRQLPY